MIRHFILEKALTLLFVSTALFAQKMEFTAIDQPGTGVKGIANNGDAILVKYTYTYDAKELIPKESFVSNYSSMNAQGDILAFGTLNGLLQPIYKKAGTTEWLGTGYFPDYTETVATPYSISNNGRYITGQMNSIPFMYDTELKKITSLKTDEFTFGAGYGVSNDGIAVGWLDRNINGTFRELAVMQIGKPIEIILPEFSTPINNHIWHIEDNGIVVGDISKHPYYYNLKTKEFKILELPIGFTQGTFISSSNGIMVGFVQNSTPADRDAIIYHPSMGNRPKLIREILTEQGIEITIHGGKLGQANVISPNGDFIGGNEIGNGNIAPGWILKLNGYFDQTNLCNINIPEDIEVNTILGENSKIVNYEVTSDCSDYKLVLVNGFASGSEFPIGVTQVSYNLLDNNDEIVSSASFKVYVNDSYCTPKFKAIVEPITLVKIGSINNQSTPFISAQENEYFLDQSTDLEQGKTYEITVAGNTNGPDTNEFVVFFDLDQNGTFEPDTEGFYVGNLAGSTGVDGKTVSKSIQIPANAKEGKTRMRIMKTYRLVPDDPCSQIYAFGQSENYTVNIVKNLAVSDVNSKKVKIYPNPIQNILSIEAKSVVKNVRIINMAGQEVYIKQLNKINPQINVSHLPKGVYILNVETNEEITTQKIIKD